MIVAEEGPSGSPKGQGFKISRLNPKLSGLPIWYSTVTGQTSGETCREQAPKEQSMNMGNLSGKRTEHREDSLLSL